MATTAIRFDASGERLRISSGLWDYNSAYTFVAWVYVAVDRATNYQSIFCRYGGGDMMDQLYLDASMRIATYVANSASTDVTGATLSTGTWYYLAMVRESTSSLKVYIDGSATATLTNTRSVTGRTDGTPLLDLSTNNYTEWYNGRMAFARVFTAALSNAEINAEMAATAAVLTGEWADWPLQADDDDISGNARHFTTSGTVTYSEAGPDIGGGTAYTQSVSGTLTTAGAIAKSTGKAVAGALTTAGSLTRQAAKLVAGALTTAGTLTKQAAKVLAGELTSAGTLATSRLYSQVVAGTLTTAGALVRQANKVVAGALTTAGALARSIAKLVAGALTTAGALVADFIPGGTLFTQAVGGTLTTAGALAKSTGKAVAGTLTTVGAITRSIAKLVAGTLTTVGALLREHTSPSAAKLDVTLTDEQLYTCTLADARTYTCTLTDALTYTVTLRDSTT